MEYYDITSPQKANDQTVAILTAELEAARQLIYEQNRLLVRRAGSPQGDLIEMLVKGYQKRRSSFVLGLAWKYIPILKKIRRYLQERHLV